MDALLNAAASALATGNPLRALNCVALREDAPALALRGIAMAQLGDLPAARQLLVRAARAFGPDHPVPHARCIVAQAEIAFVSRDLGWPVEELDTARKILDWHGDTLNAVHARHLQARRFLLLGRTEEAGRLLEGVDASPLPPPRRAAHEMIVAGLAMQRLLIPSAREALVRAETAARQCGIAALQEEVQSAARRLDLPAARHHYRGQTRPILLEEVAVIIDSGVLVVDACRRVVRQGKLVVPLVSRPVLWTLARTLAEAWPGDVGRAALLQAVFQARRADDSHRARLRVEIGRLRQLLNPLAEVQATPSGFALRPVASPEIHVLAWPAEEEHGAVLAFLADGEAWSSSALALALGISQRTVQRSLEALAGEGKAQWFGQARARRWTASPVSGFTTTMLLPNLHPGG